MGVRGCRQELVCSFPVLGSERDLIVALDRCCSVVNSVRWVYISLL